MLVVLLASALVFASGCGESEPADSTDAGEDATVGRSADTQTGTFTFAGTNDVSTRQLVAGARDMCRNHSLESLAEFFRTAAVPREVATAYAESTGASGKPFSESDQSKMRRACLSSLLSR